MKTVTNRPAVGQSVPRAEDQYLLRGKGRYTDDVNLPGQTHAYILRSPIAHGIIRSIGITPAKKLAGVLAIYTSENLTTRGYGPLPCIVTLKNRDGSDPKKPENHALVKRALEKAGRTDLIGTAPECLIPVRAPRGQTLPPGKGKKGEGGYRGPARRRGRS